MEVLELDSVEDLFQSVWKYHRIDLLFLDIDLPGMDGLTALEKIKQERALAKVPVIMLTGNSDPQIVKKAIRGRCCRVRPKAFHHRESVGTRPAYTESA